MSLKDDIDAAHVKALTSRGSRAVAAASKRARLLKLQRMPAHPVRLEVMYDDGRTEVLPKLHADMTAAYDVLVVLQKREGVKSVRPVVQTQLPAR